MRELKGDWRDLFNGFMLALDLRKMFLGFVGLALSVLFVGWYLYAWDRYDPLVLRDPTVLRLDRAETRTLPRCERMFHPKTVMNTESPALTCQGVRLAFCEMAHRSLRSGDWAVRILVPLGVGLILLVIWSYLGGAIARIAAVEVARDERIETNKALVFAHKKNGAFFWAPVVCVIFYLFFALCNVGGGLVGWGLNFGGHFHLGSVLVALGLPLAVLSGFIMLLIMLGTLFGSPLFHPAIGAEGTDSFDAISRGFSYVFSRPWHYAGYQLVAAAYGVICVVFVWWFGRLMLVLGLGAGRLGMAGRDAEGVRIFDRILPKQITANFFGSSGGYSDMAEFWDLPWLQIAAGLVVGIWLFVLFGMLMGYVVSYVYSSQTLVYFLLRKKVDGIEMSEVYEEKEEEEFKPEGGTAAAAGPEAAPPPPAGGESKP